MKTTTITAIFDNSLPGINLVMLPNLSKEQPDLILRGALTNVMYASNATGGQEDAIADVLAKFDVITSDFKLVKTEANKSVYTLSAELTSAKQAA